jgi:hypothetical protein
LPPGTTRIELANESVEGLVEVARVNPGHMLLFEVGSVLSREQSLDGGEEVIDPSEMEQGLVYGL